MTPRAAAPDLHQSCIVEASAGTGKTTALVNRIVDALAAGVSVDTIVAVTFTHAAAGNMKLRVRHQLEVRRATEQDPTVRDWLSTAARSLDRAFIGTIHSFCAQLLRHRPVEAGIDPDFRELSQPGALRVFSTVFRNWIERRLSSPSPALARALARLAWREQRSTQEPLDALQYAAWTLTEHRDFDAPWETRPFHRDAQLNDLLEKAQHVVDLRNRCGRRSDILHSGLTPLAEFVERYRRALRAGSLDNDLVEADLLRLPYEMKWLKPGSGQYGPGVLRESLVAAWQDLQAAIETFQIPANADLATALRDELWEVVDLYRQEKQRTGQLDFLDLLLRARHLLHDDLARRDLQSIYSRLFVDEFQDTDPLQAEILLLLAADDPAERDWRRATPAPGKLFVVGDPKQSIYRFRRADARLYRRIHNSLQSAGVATHELTTSTRSTRAIQGFVNAAFQHQIDNYLPLEGGVPLRPGQPGIVALPMPEPYGTRNISKARIDDCSPGAVAAFIEWLVRESGWKVRSRAGEWVDVLPEHVCILFRRFTNNGVDLTQEYVRCLEARGVPHLLVGSKSFHQREEVATLRTALRAVEWPEDELSVFAVLRGSLFAVPDDTLLRFRRQHHRFHPMMDLPGDLSPDFIPVHEALSLLADLHRRRNHRPLADTINALLEAARAHAGFAFRKGGERVLANVYRLADLARAFEASGAATSFRAFVDYLETEGEGSDTSEAPVLEQYAGGVQLMTVHKAKGLEFPIVILADLTARLTGSAIGDRYSDPERKLCAQRLLQCIPWELLEAEGEAKAEHDEALRVAYVAATRARDLLVVCAIGEQETEDSWLTPLHAALYPPSDRWRTAMPAPGCPKFGSATVLNRPPELSEEVSIRPGLHRPKLGEHEVVWFDPSVLPLKTARAEGVENEQVLSGTTEQGIAGLRQYRQWADRRTAVLLQGASPRFQTKTAQSVTRAAEAGHIPVSTIKLPSPPSHPSNRRFGRIVHEILQFAESAGEADHLAEVLARKHGAPELAAAASGTVKAALSHPVLAAPPASKRYRELPVSVRLNDGVLLEGVVDLAWCDGSSWTVVDYKTGSPQNRHNTQVQIYALALERTTGLPARAIVLEL